MELIGKKVLVRAHSAGVYYGTLKAVEGRTSNCRFSIYVEEVVILDACQIIPCTDEAVKNIESVESWVY